MANHPDPISAGEGTAVSLVDRLDWSITSLVDAQKPLLLLIVPVLFLLAVAWWPVERECHYCGEYLRHDPAMIVLIDSGDQCCSACFRKLSPTPPPPKRWFSE